MSFTNAGPSTTSTNVQLFGGDAADGVTITSGATKLAGFHGTAVVQASAIATIASGTAATTATYGTPTPDIATLFTAVNSILAALRGKGIIGS